MQIIMNLHITQRAPISAKAAQSFAIAILIKEKYSDIFKLLDPYQYHIMQS